jgi:hypothetical protein
VIFWHCRVPLHAGGLSGRRAYVGAQADRVLTVAGAQHAHHPGMADAAMQLDPPFGELGGHHIRCAVLFQAQLRIGVQIAADLGQLVLIGRIASRSEWVTEHSCRAGKPSCGARECQLKT